MPNFAVISRWKFQISRWFRGKIYCSVTWLVWMVCVPTIVATIINNKMWSWLNPHVPRSRHHPSWKWPLSCDLFLSTFKPLLVTSSDTHPVVSSSEVINSSSTANHWTNLVSLNINSGHRKVKASVTVHSPTNKKQHYWKIIRVRTISFYLTGHQMKCSQNAMFEQSNQQANEIKL